MPQASLREKIKVIVLLVIKEQQSNVIIRHDRCMHHTDITMDEL
jgi:hypothetical protein